MALEDSAVRSLVSWLQARRLELSVAALSVLVHSLVVTASLVPEWRSEPLVSGDAVSYLVPARSMLETGRFSRDVGLDRRWEPYRTPGYPLVLAASLALTGGVAAALYVPCLTAGLAAWSAARLALEWGGDVKAAGIAGVMVAFLPNSLGLSALLLNDAIFAHVFLVWLLMTWNAMSKSDNRFLVGSGAACCVLQALKPTFNLAPCLILLVACSVGGLRSRARDIVLLVLLSTVTPLYFASRNLEDHGVLSPSMLGTEATREYLQVRALAADRGVNEEEMQKRVRATDREAAARLSIPQSPYGRLYIVKKAAVRDFVSAQPVRTVWLMATEAFRQFLAPQEFVARVFLGEVSTLTRVAGSGVTVAIWGFMFVGGWALWKRGLPGPVVCIAGVFMIFLGAGSVSHWVGGRLRLPLDIAAAPLLGVGVAHLSTQRSAI